MASMTPHSHHTGMPGYTSMDRHLYAVPSTTQHGYPDNSHQYYPSHSLAHNAYPLPQHSMSHSMTTQATAGKPYMSTSLAPPASLYASHPNSPMLPAMHGYGSASMSVNGTHQHHGLATGHSQMQAPNQNGYQPSIPVQVVGQQGIRAPLPSANGERVHEVDLASIKQDENKQWPCPYCKKSYMHLKHLRRHLSRHTGETPYTCQLCNRDFGRSDVLKRHYQKCAARRGVPVGDHLAGQRGHPKRNSKLGRSSAPRRGAETSSRSPTLSTPSSSHHSPDTKGQSIPLPDYVSQNPMAYGHQH